MKILFLQLILVLTSVACDSNLSVKVGNLPTVPTVYTGAADGEGYNAAFVPDVEIQDEGAVSFLWTKVSGPGEVYFDDPTIKSPSLA